MTLTSYRSVPSQTDSSPFITSIGEHVHPHGVAVSRDLLKRWGGPLDYGDMIYVEGFGLRVVNDTMHERHKQHIDLWVETLEEERSVGVKRGRIWLVHPITKETK
jgi:3D (Asp-Asp-Asp) domain-containing protein